MKLDAKLVRIQERFIANDTRCSWSQRPKISPKAVHGPHHEEGRIHKSRNEREVKISKSSSDKKPGAKDRDAEMIGNSRRKSVHAPATKREKKLKNCSKGMLIKFIFVIVLVDNWPTLLVFHARSFSEVVFIIVVQKLRKAHIPLRSSHLVPIFCFFHLAKWPPNDAVPI